MKEEAKRSAKQPGLPPGTLAFVGRKRTESVRIRVVDYGREVLETFDLEQVADCSDLTRRHTNLWVHMSGLHRVGVVERLGHCFQIPSLILEDILNTGHRPKVEFFDQGIFVLLKFFSMDPITAVMEVEQVCFVLTEEALVSFQESDRPIFEPVIKRLSNPRSRLRQSGPDYLLYCLMDLVVDHYFVVLEALGDRIEDLEEALFDEQWRELLDDIHRVRRQCLFMRRATLPLREAVTVLWREEGSLMKETTQPYLKDLYEHVLQALDILDNHREMGSALLEVYLSTQSNRMNEVMKVLTIIATIFIPVTFIAGVYGMNFEHMPELKWPWAYPAVWIVMIAVGVLMLLFFRKKRWL